MQKKLMTGEERDKKEMEAVIKQRFNGKYPKPKNEKGDLKLIKEYVNTSLDKHLADNYIPKNYGFTKQRDPLAADLIYHGTFKDFFKRYKKYYI